MGVLVHPSFVSKVLRRLPAPLLRWLDQWSERQAQRRWEQRQRRWRQRQVADSRIS